MRNTRKDRLIHTAFRRVLRPTLACNNRYPGLLTSGSGVVQRRTLGLARLHAVVAQLAYFVRHASTK
jgi:hypothetical protein